MDGALNGGKREAVGFVFASEEVGESILIASASGFLPTRGSAR